MKLNTYSSSWRFIVLIIVTLLFTPYTHAQESQVSQTANNTQAIILANIAIYDSKITSQNNTSITIGFDIANNADTTQSDIKYGIDIVKKSIKGQTIVDSFVSAGTLTLAGHETQSKTLTYTIPPFLSGEYELWVISRTTGGLMLGLSAVGTTTFTNSASYTEIVPESCHVTVSGETDTYTLYQGVDVAPEETLSLSCTVINPSEESVTVTPTFETHRRTMYGERITTPVSSETVTLNGNEEKTTAFIIPKASEPQAYDVSMQLTSTESKQPLSNKVVAHYVLRGASATIQIVTLDRDSYGVGDTLSAHFFWSPSADGFADSRAGSGTEIGTTTVLMSVTNDDGIACIEPISTTLNPAQTEYTIQAPVIAPCISPQALFTLVDEQGNTLDARTIESPPPAPVLPTVTPEPTETPFWNMLNIAILLAVISSLIILLVVIRMLLHVRSTSSENNTSTTILKALIFTVIAGTSVFGGVGEVEAVTFKAADWNIAASIDINYMLYTVNTDKVTYAPGETVVLSGSAYASFCSNGTPSNTLTATLNGVSASLINTYQGGRTTLYFSGSIPAPTIPGNYNIELYGCYNAGGYCGSASIPITVIAPAVSCVGSWNNNGTCSVTGACGQTGSVQQTFTQTTPASGGASCTSIYGGEHGATRWGGTSCATAICTTPDLTSQSLSVPSSALTNTAFNLSAIVSNIGNNTTGSGFSDNFSYSFTSNTGPWTNLPNIAKSALTSGATSADVDTYTPTQAGTLYIQHCVDSTNAIAESVEVPNCTVSAGTTVSAPPSPCLLTSINDCFLPDTPSGENAGACISLGACNY
ncbi:MAG: hypothetical protein NUW00_04160, partial [Candidatus Kaiserbacteria bacterium]|nr:hypothetical protein [Candidatus Kaiserbacteria bacterium]